MIKLFLFIYIILFSFPALANEFEGIWERIDDTCRIDTWFDREMDRSIYVVGKRVTFGYAIGKVNKSFSGKKSIGINLEQWGHLKGKLKGNQLHVKIDPSFKNEYWNKISECNFIYAKNVNNKNINLNKKSKNKFLYCEDNMGKVFASYRSCKFKEISKAEFDLRKKNKTNNATVLSKNLNFYCKDRNGKVFNLKKPLHNNQVNKCGTWMSEISKAEYNSIKNRKIAKTTNTNNVNANSLIKDSNIKEVNTVKILNNYFLKDHFIGNRDTDFYVKKGEVYKLINLRQNFNFALITNTNDWKKKGSIEGWIPIKFIKILDEKFVFNNTDTNKKIEKQNTKKVTKQVVNYNNKDFYCKDRNGKVFNLKKPLHNNKVNKCGSMMKEISKSQYDSIKNRTISITTNKTNNKKGSYENIAKNYVMNKKITVTKKTEITPQTIEIENDLEGPNIEVANTFEANNELTASIQGQITDQSAIVSLVIDGDEVSIVNGSFNKELYVFPSGQEVEIIARDKHGNKSETTVQLVRATVVVQEDKFDFLDPRKIKAKTNKNAVAIIIGIEDYENTFAAPFATNDAVTFNDFARLSLGIPANNIKLLTNDEAERNDTLKVLRTWLPKKIIDNQTELYVFYSGHGLASDDGTDLYLLPADGEPDILEDTTILRNKIFDIVAELNPKRVTMFFDTCYSGATRDEEFLVAAKPIFIEAAEQDIPTNFNIFSASSGRETAKVLKEAEHGLFSYYMMKGLEGDADVNNDNQITNGELIAFVNKNVSRQANQTPQFNGDPDQVLVQW